MSFSVDKYALYSTIITICAISSCLLSSGSFLPLVFTIIGTLLIIKGNTKKYKSFISVPTIFTAFALLYAVSGPISVLFTGELTAPFYGPYKINDYLLLHNLAILGLILSEIILPIGIQRNHNISERGLDAITFVPSTLILSLLSSVFEIVNFVRVGGFNLISQGKSVYQGAVADITFTLPASALAVAAFSLLGLVAGNLIMTGEGKRAIKLAILVIVSSGFEVFLNLVLGQRLELFSYAIAFTLGYTTYKKIPSLRIKHFVVLACVYLSSVALYSYRWLLPQIITSGSLVHANYSEINNSMLMSVNPGRSEFGAPFGNFTMYNNLLNYPLKLGETYLAGATIPIPTVLFPGGKPLDITYVFRNDVSSTNISSSISGTGFSSLLESFINFSFLGPFIVYFIIGLLIRLLEKARYSNNILLVIICMFISPLSMTFHRSGSGAVFSLLSWLPLIWFIIYITNGASVRSSRGLGSQHTSTSDAFRNT